MKLGQKITLTNLITIAVFIIVCAVVFITLIQLADNQNWVNHTYNVIGDGEQLLSHMVDQETGMRGFLVTGNETYLEPYIKGKAGFSELMAELQVTVNDNPVQVERLKGIESMAGDWDSKAVSVFISIRREISQHDQYKDAVSLRMNDGTGKMKMDTFRTAIEPYINIDAAGDVLTAMINMETGLRGFIAAEDEEFLEPYYAGKNDIVLSLNELGFTRITTLANDWINNYAEVQIADTLKSLEFQDREDLNQKLAQNIGKQYMDGIRAEIADFIQMESDLLISRNTSAVRQTNISYGVIIGGAIFATVIAIILSMLVTRSITKQVGGEPDEIAGIVEKVAAGDLSVRFEEGKTIGIYGSMKQMVSSLSNIIANTISGAQQIAVASEQLASGNQDLSNRTEQQASALEETSSAIEEMNSSIKSNADNTSTADQLSRDAVIKTDEGATAVSRMIESMNEISESSNRIADIIEVITNIAFQTNLLALNASIEAARAGEQGKGFAVVAVEVRKLAKRSDRAAEEITGIIKNSNTRVNEGVEIANTAGEVLDEINGAVKKVTALVSEISAASQEQLSSVDQIDKTLSSLDENTQRNAALVEEAASSTEELSAQAQELNSSMEFFKLSSGARIGVETGERAKKSGSIKRIPATTMTKNSAKGFEGSKAVSGAAESNQDAYESFSDLVDEGQFDEF